ncbi:MAG: hypothetical protein HYY13_06065 [Nitrospirae bacterium]|nr:hypothetical protein [Nitrospirota bacterium]
MLRRVPNRLIKPEEIRAGLSWYTDSTHDLYVWADAHGRVTRFQFTFGKGTEKEEVVEWKGGRLVGHALVDPGDPDGPAHKRSPVIVADGLWSRADVARKFEAVARRLEPDIAALIRSCLADHSIEPDASQPHGRPTPRRG